MNQKIKVLKGRITIIIFCLLVIGIILMGARRYFFYDLSIEVDTLFTKEIRHRGLYSHIYPENTFSAIQESIEEGFDVEFDLRFTKDHEVVIFHDELLDRMTNAQGSIESYNYHELVDFQINDSEEIIPTLDYLINHIDGSSLLLMDIKCSGYPSEMMEKIKSIMVNYDGKYAIQSFNPLVGVWMDRHWDEVAFGQISNGIFNTRFKFLINLKDNICNLIGSPNFVSYEVSILNNHNLNHERSKGLFVLGWGDLDSLEEYERIDLMISHE